LKIETDKYMPSMYIQISRFICDENSIAVREGQREPVHSFFTEMTRISVSMRGRIA